MKKKEFYNKELGTYRKKIDKIDNKIINLLNKRGKIVQKVGSFKNKVHMDINQPQREKEIIERMKLKSMILKNISVETIWRDIIEACKVIESLKVSDEKC